MTGFNAILGSLLELKTLQLSAFKTSREPFFNLKMTFQVSVFITVNSNRKLNLSVWFRARRVKIRLSIVQSYQLFKAMFEISHEREATRSLKIIFETSWRINCVKTGRKLNTTSLTSTKTSTDSLLTGSYNPAQSSFNVGTYLFLCGYTSIMKRFVK